MHLHLDPVGGIAGDMFCAALLDLWPARAAAVTAALAALDLPPGVAAAPLPFDDGTLTGTRFLVAPPARDVAHRPHREIRAMLDRAALPPGIRTRAQAIFALLADVEGRIHGVAPDDVAFHEVGAWDSIVDIVAAATLIDGANAATWSVAPIPVGSGRVRSAHGDLPVPAPAVARLLEGFAVFDDGRPGERVTPTGAAILRHLAPAAGLPRAALRLDGTGYGFGTRRFKGISNVLRVTCLAPLPAPGWDEVAVLRFEIDDQTAEDLAVGLERLRAQDGVLDVLQVPAFGKKGRMLAQIQVLARPARAAAIAEACLAETTTLGVRLETATRRVLTRALATGAAADGAAIRVKTAIRPDGTPTTKAEMDDIAAAGGDHAARARRRRMAEDGAG